MRGCHSVRRPDLHEEGPEHPGVALDRPVGARATFFLNEEGHDRLGPGRHVFGKLGREEVWVHRRSPEGVVVVHITHSGGRRSQHDGLFWRWGVLKDWLPASETMRCRSDT